MGDESKKLDAEGASNANTGSDKNKLLKTLNDYKELVSILVFFAGGVIWLYAAFATKTYVDEFNVATRQAIKEIRDSNKKSTAKIKCVLGGSIEVYSKGTEIRFHQDEITSYRIDLEKLKNQKLNRSEFIEQSEKIKNKIDKLETEIQAALKIKIDQEMKLKNEECSK